VRANAVFSPRFFAAIRLLGGVAAAALWLLACGVVTYGAYELSNEIEDCYRLSYRAEPVSVENEFPSPRGTCTFQRADGSVFLKSDYTNAWTLAAGLLVGLVPAGTFIWLGLGRPELRVPWPPSQMSRR
jgi:hypothetical protein